MILLHLNEVVFVGDDYNLNTRLRVLVHLLEPVVQVEEGLRVEKVEDENDAISTCVVGIGDGTISLLASGIPDLKLYLLVHIYNWVIIEN